MSLLTVEIYSQKQKKICSFCVSKGICNDSKEGYYAFSETYNKVIELHGEDEIAKVLKKDTELFFQISFDEYLNWEERAWFNKSLIPSLDGLSASVLITLLSLSNNINLGIPLIA